ncbi:hypothetical protein L6452_34053 [Arctium lappa]|uniref:Uncharacterized protein n=1 Tax=Arctium lappa TaxID=4217 RepID=A0ACB8YH55_ARCLA|nr:hypothetical protein L6452_34053 [Arctium lappa]
MKEEKNKKPRRRKMQRDWKTLAFFPNRSSSSSRSQSAADILIFLADDQIVVDVIDFQMGRSFKNHRAKLKEHFLKCHGEEDVERAKGMKPTDSNITNDAWCTLCDYWSSEKFHAMSSKNSENRGKRKYVSLNGTVSTPNHHLRNRGLSDDPSLGEIETFRKLHYREKDGWVNDYSRTSYEKMVEIKRHTESIENPPGDLEIMQQVFGKRPAYIRGWSRVPSTRSDSTSSRHSTGSSSRLSHTEMSIRLDSTESELASTKSELASTKSELVLMKGEMAELRQMVSLFVSGQPRSSFSSSLNAQEHGSETRDR